MRRNPFVSAAQIDRSDPEEARDYFDLQYADLSLLERLHGRQEHESAESIVRDMIREGWTVSDDLVEYARVHEIESFDVERVHALRNRHDSRLGIPLERKSATAEEPERAGSARMLERDD